jgi:hypothetical protein
MIVGVILMVKQSLNEEGDFKQFLGIISNIYNSPGGFPRLEKCAGDYHGKYTKEFSRIMNHIYSANNGSNSRIFALDIWDLEQILDKTRY